MSQWLLKTLFSVEKKLFTTSTQKFACDALHDYNHALLVDHRNRTDVPYPDNYTKLTLEFRERLKTNPEAEKLVDQVHQTFRSSVVRDRMDFRFRNTRPFHRNKRDMEVWKVMEAWDPDVTLKNPYDYKEPLTSKQLQKVLDRLMNG